jgi:hypothetical protein
MINLSHLVRGVTLYISVAENATEQQQLETLVRELEFISKTYIKTGLYVVQVFTHLGKFIVVTSLKKKESIKDEDLAIVVNRIDKIVTNL